MKATKKVVYHCPECAYVKEQEEESSAKSAQIQRCPNDRTILIAGSGLDRLDEPRRCSFGLFGDEIRCENMAHWSFNGFSLCQEHLQEMADMNGDNYEAVKEVLEEASNARAN